MHRALLGLLSLSLVACGGSKSSPTSPDAAASLQGQTVNAIDGSAAGAVSVQVGNRFAIQSDANGHFDVDGLTGTYGTVFAGSGIVERHTNLTGPTSSRTRVSLIPSSFDLAAFDEMIRGSNNRLQRWTSRPSLVVLGTVMKYSSSATERFEATAERLTDDEVSTLVSQLNEGLALLTGGTHTTFASVDVEWPRPGEQVDVQRNGRIVIGRYAGINSFGQTIGYGSWAEHADGSVVGGSVWLDRDFDRDDSRRRLLRIHELGHALGYNHVTGRPSIMNPSIGPEPNDFDRGAASIAFQRPVGNTSPDRDPNLSARTFVVAEGAPRWSERIR